MRGTLEGRRWHAFSLLLGATALVVVAWVLDLRSTVISGDRIEHFGFVIQSILSAVAGVICYLSWRVNGTRAVAWVGGALLFLALQDFPFLVAQLASPSDRPTAQGEGSEVFAALFLLALFIAAARNTAPIPFDPLVIGVFAAALMTGIRYLVGHTSLLPSGFVNGTAWYERAAVALICLAILVTVVRTRDCPRRMRIPLIVVVVATGVQCTLDSALTAAPPPVPATVVAVAAALLGLLLLDGSIRCLWGALERHQQRMEEVARRAMAAESRAQEDADLLHEVRSTVGGIAAATVLLSTRAELSDEQRSRLQGALAEQLLRMDRSLNRASHEVQTFDVVTVMEPVVDFHRSSGQVVTWVAGAPTPSTGPGTQFAGPPAAGVTQVVHVPDAVAQVLGTLLHNAARHAPGAPVSLHIDASQQHVLLAVSQPGPAVAQEVRDQLFERGARSTASPGQGLGLHVARRLMAEHDGDLFLRESHAHRTTFVMALPRQRAATDPGVRR